MAGVTRPHVFDGRRIRDEHGQLVGVHLPSINHTIYFSEPDMTGAPTSGTRVIRADSTWTKLAYVIAPSEVRTPHWMARDVEGNFIRVTRAFFGICAEVTL